MSEPDEKIVEWADSLGIPVEDLMKRFEQNIEMVKRTHPGYTEEQIYRTAKYKVYTYVKSAKRSPSKPFDAIYFGYSTKRDIWAARKAAAKQALSADPDTRRMAIQDKLIDSQGNILDTNGRIITGEVWARNIVGFGRPAIGGVLKLVVGSLLQEVADKIPLLKKTMRANFNLRDEDENRYVVNSARITSFRPVSIEEVAEELDDGAVCNILMNAPEEIHPNLSDMEAWHKQNQNDVRRVVIFDGNMIFRTTTPSPIGNYSLVLEDPSIMDVEAEGVTINLPEELESMLTFGRGSHIVGAGYTRMGPSFNPDTNQFERDRLRVQVDAYCVYAIPDERFPLDEEYVISAETVD